MCIAVIAVGVLTFPEMYLLPQTLRLTNLYNVPVLLSWKHASSFMNQITPSTALDVMDHETTPQPNSVLLNGAASNHRQLAVSTGRLISDHTLRLARSACLPCRP